MGFEGEIKKYPGSFPEKPKNKFSLEHVQFLAQSEAKDISPNQKSAWKRLDLTAFF